MPCAVDYLQLREGTFQNDYNRKLYRYGDYVCHFVHRAVYRIYDFQLCIFSHRFRKIRRNLKEYNGDLKTLHRIQEQEYDAIIDELGEEGGEAK